MRVRNFTARDAKAGKGGAHQDRRTRRRRTRAAQRRHALKCQQG